MGLFDSSSATSSVIGLVLSILFNWIYSECKPFKEVGDSYLAIGLSYSLSIFFLASLIIKTNIMSELGLNDDFFGIVLAILLGIGPISVVVVQLIELLPIFRNWIKEICTGTKIQPEAIDDTMDKKTEHVLGDALNEAVHSPMSHIGTHLNALAEEDDKPEKIDSDANLCYGSEAMTSMAGLQLHSTSKPSLVKSFMSCLLPLTLSLICEPHFHGSHTHTHTHTEQFLWCM